jgi:pilin isopeptide linkage protein
MKRTKQALAMVVAAAMVLGMSAPAWAATTATENTGVTSGTADTEGNILYYQDENQITITKSYNAANTGTISPAETFEFTIERDSVTDAASDVTSTNMPLPTIGSVTYEAGDAGNENTDKKDRKITVSLPKYESVGIYSYIIKETASDTAGVTYYSDNIKLVVTVNQGADGKIRVAAVHTEGEGKAKSDNFPNVYSAGSLAVTKKVTGNMGDQSKEFNVTVTFTQPLNKVVKEVISYEEDSVTKTITADAWKDGIASATIALKHDETITFTNIPYDVTYTVAEDTTYKTNDGYDDAVYTFGDENKIIDSEKDTVTITNNKGTTIDTGVVLDSLPYILILAAVAIGIGAFVIRKRDEDQF